MTEPEDVFAKRELFITDVVTTEEFRVTHKGLQSEVDRLKLLLESTEAVTVRIEDPV